MLSASKTNRPVESVLRFDMVIDGERMDKGDVVELSHKDFVYLSSHERVALATKENVAAVRAEIQAAKEAEERAKMPSEADILRQRVADLEAELAAKKGK